MNQFEVLKRSSFGNANEIKCKHDQTKQKNKNTSFN